MGGRKIPAQSRKILAGRIFCQPSQGGPGMLGSGYDDFGKLSVAILVAFCFLFLLLLCLLYGIVLVLMVRLLIFMILLLFVLSGFHSNSC